MISFGAKLLGPVVFAISESPNVFIRLEIAQNGRTITITTIPIMMSAGTSLASR